MAPNSRKSKMKLSNRLVRKPTIQQSLPKNELVELKSTHDKACMFCGKKESSEMLYGPLYQFGNVVVHFFCILLSEKSFQNGTDEEGILGFLLKDIRIELNRSSKQLCCYCHNPGASISCCKMKCSKLFHLPCGLENGSMHQYFESYKSFCAQHRITQTVDRKELKKTLVPCGICKENIKRTKTSTSLWAPCCKRNAWFHRKCVQEMALNAGFYFKCPLCNNFDKFNKRMLDLGIYIPSRDALWKTKPNTNSEPLKKIDECCAVTCLCPHEERRKFFTDIGSWKFIFCYICGSNGTHLICSSVNENDHEWFCTACQHIARHKPPNSTTVKSNEETRLSSIFFQKSINARDARQNEMSVNMLTPTNITDSISISEDSSDDDNTSFIGIDLTLSDDSDT